MAPPTKRDLRNMTPDDVRILRQDLCLTQTQLAQLLGVHSLTVSKWERALLGPSPYHAALMCSFKQAARREPSIGRAIAHLLTSAGIGLALFHLLRAAFEEVPEVVSLGPSV